MIRMHPMAFAACSMLGLLVGVALADDPAQALKQARTLLLRGRYEEAAEVFEQHKADAPVQAALGLAQCRRATGQSDKAIELLSATAAAHPQAAALHGELAWLYLEKSDYDAAAKAVAAALKADAHQTQARWVQAELHRLHGRLEEAEKAVAWFVEYYNQQGGKFTDADTLRWLGLGVAQHARWQREHALFQDLINTVYADCLDLEPNYWPAHLETGLLFLEKYNQAEAQRSFQAALKINPQAAEVLAALAELALQNFELDKAQRLIEAALEINPQLAQAHWLQSDWYVANFQRGKALASLTKARELCPLHEEVLAREAALDMLANGSPEKGASVAARILRETEARNPRAGLLYFRIAEKLVDAQRFTLAEQFFREAIRRQPKLIGPHGELGMLYMRLARETEAKQLLDESFATDPFNVRVKNMLEVLDVLATYATLETEHFIIRFDRGQDEILAQYAAKYLEEEVYPRLCQQFNFRPEGKSLFEIFNKAKNSSGHNWFSARMIGLPYIHTVGACAGKIVAMTSPNSVEQPFNWSRVLQHEFIHVLNLQQTHFNIPHWFTEGMATLNEGYPRPPSWNRLLAARHANKTLFTLENVNLGFIRPQSGDDWQMAYCQAELYCEYMLARFGSDALAKLLAAFAETLETPEAIRKAFGVDAADFDKGYAEYVSTIVAELPFTEEAEEELGLADLLAAAQKDPTNAELLAKVALAHLEREDYAKARQSAKAALMLRKSHPLASYVLARTYLIVGDNDQAVPVLEQALDPKAPHPRVLQLLAGLKLKSGDVAGAEKLYEMGYRANPQDGRWLKALAGLYLKSGDDEKLSRFLQELAALDGDEFAFRKKLAQLALARRDYAAAARWAAEANHVNVLDADVHELWAAAFVGQENLSAAIAEYEVAVRLRPKKLATRLELAKTCLRAGDKAKAQRVLQELLKLDPNHTQAQELLEKHTP